MPIPRFRRSPFWHPASWLTLLLASALLVPLPADARSSGGYSRSGGSSFSRTPSFGGGGGGYRTPSTSGGYGRSRSYSDPSSSVPQGAGDRSLSQGRSGAALDSYRQQQAPRPAPQTSPQYAPQQPYSQGYSPRQQYAPNRAGWYGSQGWSAPSPGWFGANRSFGVWDGLFLWSLLNNLGRTGSGEWFHNNQNDPGYQQWRQEANRQAQDNADLRQKLDELDAKLAAKADEPRTPGGVPPGVPPEVAKAAPERTPSVAPLTGGGNGIWVVAVILAGGGAIGYLALKRRPKSGGPAVSLPSTTLGSAAAMLRHKLSGDAYTPSKFRVGMTIQVDPSPFILAGPGLKVPQPAGGEGGQISVSGVGQVEANGTRLVRLYLSDGRSLVQLHLDPAGDPDECRLFGTIDEVTPADPGEWGAWLDANEGMIGWPDFQTKDGKSYQRVWAPGPARVSPRQFTETLMELGGTRSVTSQVMLYAARTGVPAPGPQAEFIMVSACQDGARAWVEIRAGIDINPVTLQLA